MQLSKPSLEIYKSSAGSGKTTTLAREYILLLAEESFGHQHILAVTFTRKATAEIKDRIVKNLHSLKKYGIDTQIPKPVELIGDELSQIFSQRDTGIDKNNLKNYVRNFATDRLNKILHDYGRFSISTIDSFFQRIIRSFSRELDIAFNFEVELDNQKVLEESISSLYDQIGINKKDSLSNIMIQYISDKMEETGSWNLDRDIGELGNELFNEEISFIQNTIHSTNEDYARYIDGIFQINTGFEDIMENYCLQWERAMRAGEMTYKDFKGGSRSFAQVFNGKFRKSNKNYERTATFLKACEDPLNMVTLPKSKKGEQSINLDFIRETMYPLLIEINEFLNDHISIYNTAIEIKKKIYAHSLLNDLKNEVYSYLKKNDQVLISHTNARISEIIDGSDAPFIYEKMGSVYNHYLIDEFQDTSTFQWQNFRPLVENCMAEDHYNMIVGDAKQSIYRWRGGNINLILSDVQQDLNHFDDNIVVKTLQDNYRSQPNIIRFNNTLFVKILNLFKEKYPNTYQKISPVYADCIQTYPKSKDENSGLVKVLFFNDKKATGTQTEPLFEDVTNNRQSEVSNNEADTVNLTEISAEYSPDDDKEEDSNDLFETYYRIIKEKLQAGYAMKDICLLVRAKNVGAKISEYLMKKDPSIKILSDESLLVGQSPKVNLLVNLMHYLISPGDTIALFSAIYTWKVVILKESEFDFNSLDFEYSISDDETLTYPRGITSDQLMKKYFPESIWKHVDFLVKLQLYDLVESLINRLEMSESNDSFLIKFMDIVLDYVESKGSDLIGFLNHWHEKAAYEPVSISESEDAVKILTIHKSKGLEFPILILCHSHWDIQPKSKSMHWFSTQGISSLENFKQVDFPMDIVPIVWSQKLWKTEFKYQCTEECIASLVDNLNLLYVALTRAADELYIIGIIKESSKRKKEYNPDQPYEYQYISELICEAIVSETPPADEKIKKYLLNIERCSNQTLGIFSQTEEADLLPIHFSSQIGNTVQPEGGRTIKDTRNNIHLKYLPNNIWQSSVIVMPQTGTLDELLAEKTGRRIRFDWGQILKDTIKALHPCSNRNDGERMIEKILNNFRFMGRIKKTEIVDLKEQVLEILNIPKVNDWFFSDWIEITDTKIIGVNDWYLPNKVLEKKVLDPLQNCIKKSIVILDLKIIATPDDELKKFISYGNKVAELGYDSVELFELRLLPELSLSKINGL